MTQHINHIALYGALASFLTVGALTASAEDLNPGISCLDGSIPVQDYAELNSRYKESLWDTKAGMKVVSDGNPLELTVTDDYGTNVCDAEVNDRARCKFKFSASYSGRFFVRIDNSLNLFAAKYRLCAE